jgi:hypothetical protein
VTSSRLAIDDEQARWVRQIFEWFAEGWSPQKIADKLNTLKVRTARGDEWTHTAIYTNAEKGGFLCNQRFIGKLIWNRRQWKSRFDQERRKKRTPKMRDESDWVVVDAPELRIISQELWDRVQARLKVQHERGRNIRAALHDRAREPAGQGSSCSLGC